MTSSIAIIGMAAIMPGAEDITEFWENIITSRDCLVDIPEEYWTIDDFYDPDPAARDKTYSYKAGVISPIDFDSIGFGIPPTVMESISVDQLYALVVAQKALHDAGLIGEGAKPFNSEKTGVILAACTGKNVYSLSRRQDLVRTRKILVNSGVDETLADHVIARLRDCELEWTEDSEPGYIPNVTAGRIANRFNLGGTNCVVDAACASGLAALKIAVGELERGDCDMVLTGGVNLDLSPSSFISFCKTPALSRSNLSRPFDADTDGMILGDGVGMVVLKRLEDAERDNDRIYAVIRSVGASADGRAKSIFAPSEEGQLKALERAYETAGVDPATVTLIEAHGTGTFYGDECEVTALNKLYEQYDVQPGSIVIGSVKSQIGHTRLAAGIAGLIKTTLALYQKTLPPTLNVTHERAELLGSPFHTISTPQPWITSMRAPQRRAGLSAFGFGGANYHVVLEEHAPKFETRMHRIPEGICLHAADNKSLIELCHNWATRLEADPRALDDLLDTQRDPTPIPLVSPRIGFVAVDPADAIGKLRIAEDELSRDCGETQEFHADGKNAVIYYRSRGVGDVKVATLFSGQGAPYPGMFSETARDYPEMADFLATVGEALEERGRTPIAQILYPGNRGEELVNTVYAQAALAAVCAGLYDILRNRGYRSDMLIGHSFGEITGLWAGGAIDAATFADVTVERGMAMASSKPETGMLVISADSPTCEKWIAAYPHVYVANENSADQTMVAGDMGELKSLASELLSANVSCSILNVPLAFHSPYMKEPNSLFHRILDETQFAPLTTTLYSGADGKPYPTTPEATRETIASQIERPVHFMACVADAYDQGARVFVEVGPGKVLTNLVRRILGGKDVSIIAVNPERGKSSDLQLEEAIVHLRTLGLTIKPDPYRPRGETQGDKPKSAYRVDPIVYMTPTKKKIVDQAMNLVEPRVTPANTGGSDTTDMKGKQAMDTRALDVVYGIQSLNGQALEKFLASQGQQINVFSQLVKEPGSDTDDVVRLMEAFQANSMRAYDTYMKGQREILGGDLMSTDGAVELMPMPAPAPLPVSVVPRTLPPARPQPPRVAQPASMAPSPTPVAVHEPSPHMPKPVNTADVDPQEMIISIISEKTGYPEDMVDADMNLESDLGIDSIKRIEVFAELSNRLPNKLEIDDVEAIAMLHTISEIGDYLKKNTTKVGRKSGGGDPDFVRMTTSDGVVASGGGDPDFAGMTTSDGVVASGGGDPDFVRMTTSDGVVASGGGDPDFAGRAATGIKRFEVGVRQAEPEKRTDAWMDSGVVIVVKDDAGVAELVSEKLGQMGYAARLVEMPEADELVVEKMFTDVLDEAQQPLAGFIYIAPNTPVNLRADSVFSPTEISAVTSIFLCAKYFTRMFTSGEGNGFFVSAVRMDGKLGLSAAGSPVQGGLFGLHKSLNVEWHNLPLNLKTIVSKAIDIAHDVDPEQGAQWVVEEIVTYANDAGVGRTADGNRYETYLTENYPGPDSSVQLPGPDDVFVVTGGGRGITAACATRLAQSAHCGFVLLGRTDITADISWADGERDKAKLRELAIAQLHENRPRPAKIEALINSALNQMEIHDTLDAIRAAGGRAHYVSCDVQDTVRLKEIFDRDELGPITGLVHGAGAIADKTIQRKTLADFDTVFGPKVLGLDACLSSLDIDQLKYLVMFSSTSAYFGNGGQTDYSMANEVMNKFAYTFKRNNPDCTTMAVDWGLWDGGSMASDSIRNAVKDSEILLIPIDVGTRYFVDQFKYAQQPGVCQIVINCSSEMLRPQTELG